MHLRPSLVCKRYGAQSSGLIYCYVLIILGAEYAHIVAGEPLNTVSVDIDTGIYDNPR